MLGAKPPGWIERSLPLWGSLLGLVMGGLLGFVTGFDPIIASGIVGLIGLGLTGLSVRFEHIVLALLILRVVIDGFSALQLPAIFGIGLDCLTLLYLTIQLFKRQRIYTDWFLWVLIGWWLLQGMWVALLPIGGLGFNGELLEVANREWIRLLTWVMFYLLALQMRGRIHPEKAIRILFFSLVAPLTVAVLQAVAPSLLPPQLTVDAGTGGELGGSGIRLRGTIGHENGFVTYLFLFINLTFWKVEQIKFPVKAWWLGLLGILSAFYVAAKALYSLPMLAVSILVRISTRLTPLKLFGGLFFIGCVIVLFASSEFGQSRLGSIGQTPLLNHDIDIPKAIFFSKADNNSFNWRIAYWTNLLTRLEPYQVLGFGLGTAQSVDPTVGLLPHNDYVRAYVEGGMVGFGVYAALFGTQVARVVQLIRHSRVGSVHRQFCWTLLAFLLGLPIGMLTENVWSHTLLFSLWYTLLAIGSFDWYTSPETPAVREAVPDSIE